MSSIRELSKDQIFVNLYIRYKRDHEKDPLWEDIQPYKQHEKLSFEIFCNYEDIVSEYYDVIVYRKLEHKRDNESDGRKRRTIEKKLRDEAPTKKRFEQIKKEVHFQETCGKLELLNPVQGWNDTHLVDDFSIHQHLMIS